LFLQCDDLSHTDKRSACQCHPGLRLPNMVSTHKLLDVENLHAGYGAIEVLRGISLAIEAGEMVTLIGANGAGKTTTLLCISGALRLRGGRITFDGRPIEHLAAHDVVRAGISQAPEGRQIFPRLTVLENLKMGAYARRDQAKIKDDLDRNFALFPVLKERALQLGGTLSGGEQQMLALARALMGRPKLLLLDEPSLGLAPLVVQRIYDVLRQLNADGISILLVEQNARMALRCAHRGYVLETGAITASGAAGDLLNDPRVKQAYLGE
jgi:branched-chain amino acid transport system ATP-binding protein